MIDTSVRHPLTNHKGGRVSAVRGSGIAAEERAGTGGNNSEFFQQMKLSEFLVAFYEEADIVVCTT